MLKLNPDAISDVGCNIATGIILEKLAEENISDVKYLINIKTLLRNYINCLDGTTDQKIRILKSSINLNNILNGFYEDTVIVINTLMEMNIDVNIYFPDYSILATRYNGWFKETKDLTGIKFFIASIEPYIEKNIFPKLEGIAIKTNHKLQYTKDMLITTHLGFDLLNFQYKPDVKLLESHTGEIKNYTKWYTKYHSVGKADLSVLPFNEILYFTFGDDYYVKYEKINIRKQILSLAPKFKWYQGTKPMKVLMDIKKGIPGIGEYLASKWKKVYGV